MNEFTLQCFRSDWMALGGDVEDQCVSRLFDALDEGYGESGRFFHDRNHVVALFQQLEPVSSQLEDGAAVRMAVWFHDVVCAPGASGNEQASADLWCSLADGHAPKESVARVAGLVLDTRHLITPSSADGALLADIDIAGLGADERVFDHQSEQVEAEFPRNRLTECEASHRAFLAQLLDREWIYNTTHFRSECEARARANLGRFLAV